MYFLLFVLVSCRVQLTSVQELKKVRGTHFSECAYLPKCLRVLTEVSTSYLFSWVCRTYRSVYVYLFSWIRVLVVVVVSSKSPNGAILFHSPGRKPWVNRFQQPLSSVGAALPRPPPHNDTNQTCALKVPLLRSSYNFSFCVYPGFHIGLCPHSTLGYAGVSP